jgi:hypothetical protein
MEEKPHWMADHESSDRQNFDDIRNALQRIEIKLDPIYENYSAASRMGKWLMGVAVFGSVILGVLLSLKTLFNK